VKDQTRLKVWHNVSAPVRGGLQAVTDCVQIALSLADSLAHLHEISTGKDRQEQPELPTRLDHSADREQLVELNEIFMKACAQDPRKRYQTADLMCAASLPWLAPR
jgi:hypothetical protein